MEEEHCEQEQQKDPLNFSFITTSMPSQPLAWLANTLNLHNKRKTNDINTNPTVLSQPLVRDVRQRAFKELKRTSVMSQLLLSSTRWSSSSPMSRPEITKSFSDTDSTLYLSSCDIHVPSKANVSQAPQAEIPAQHCIKLT